MLQKSLGNLFCFFALIPWVSFGINDFDSQPWPLLFGVVFILSCGSAIKNPPYIALALFLSIFGLQISFAVTGSLSAFEASRTIVNYASIFVVYLAFYNYLLRYRFPWKIFVFVNFIWIFFAFVEMFSPEIVKLIAERRTTKDRGVTSLAPESTFFATYLFFNAWIMLEANRFLVNKRLFFVLCVNVAGILILAKSTMVGLFVVVSGVFVLWYKLISFVIVLRNFVCVFVVPLGVFVVSMIDWSVVAGSRIVRVTIRVLENPSLEKILLWDASINQRVEAVVMSLHGSICHNLLPAGLDTFVVTRDKIAGLYGDLFWYPTGSNKILSWIGTIVYELGVFGIVTLVVFIMMSYQGHRISRLNLMLLGLVLLAAVPLAFPLVPMLLALFAVNKRVLR